VARTVEPDAASAIEACIRELQTALDELRELARGIHPAVLSERGLQPALEALAARAPLPVMVEVGLDRRLPPAQEAALYFVAAEALTNVSKYARASSAEVRVQAADGWVEIAIADDGVGGARAEGGSGLRGLVDRIEALGGQLTLDNPPGAGTTLRARVPVAAA
jgi:signal transduction histidine kinase